MGWSEAKARRQLEKDREIARLGQAGKRILGTRGRCTLAIDQETYLHTVESNGGVQAGGKTVFDDREFVGDMQRRHEHLRLEGEAPPARKLGRVVSRSVYRADGSIERRDFKARRVELVDRAGQSRVVAF